MSLLSLCSVYSGRFDNTGSVVEEVPLLIACLMHYAASADRMGRTWHFSGGAAIGHSHIRVCSSTAVQKSDDLQLVYWRRVRSSVVQQPASTPACQPQAELSDTQACILLRMMLYNGNAFGGITWIFGYLILFFNCQLTPPLPVISLFRHYKNFIFLFYGPMFGFVS